METQNFNSFQNPAEIQTVSAEVMAKTFMAKVFTWMSVGLVVTGFMAYLFGNIPNLISQLYTPTGLTPLAWIVMFAPFGLVLLINFGVNKMSYPVMVGVFVLFAAMLGMSLSSIFIVYTASSIVSIFFITAGMFGAMALLGYTTHTDLTKLGSLLYMLLIGVIIASFVNFFLHSESFNYMLSFVCVGIFTGLTAYDVQKIKRIGSEMSGDDTVVGKASIFGALSLYLDFINLFLALLRIFGSRK